MAGTSYVATNADLTARNHVTNDARTPRTGAYDMGANEY
jgi:hypothetical protein